MCEKILCALCKAKAERYHTDDNNKYGIKCPYCGEYHLTENAGIFLGLLFNVDREMLAAYIRTQVKASANPPFLDELDIFRILVGSSFGRGKGERA